MKPWYRWDEINREKDPSTFNVLHWKITYMIIDLYSVRMLERLNPIIMFIMRMMKTFSKTFFSFLWLHEAQPSNNPEWAKTQHPLARETAREKLSLSRLHSSCGQISRWVRVKDKVHPFYVGWRSSVPYVNNYSPVTPVTATVVYRSVRSVPDHEDEGDITPLAFPRLQFSIWVSSRPGIEPRALPSEEASRLQCS